MKPTRPATLDVDKPILNDYILRASDPAIAGTLARYLKDFGSPSSVADLLRAFASAKDRACGIHIVEPIEAAYRRLNLSILKARKNREGKHLGFEPTPGVQPLIIYIRCSSKDQKDTSATLEEQLKAVAPKIHAQGAVAVAVFWDDDKGEHYSRPGLKAALAYAKQHLAQGMVVWLANRFGRNLIDGMNLAREFCNHGCPLWHRRSAGSSYRIGNTDSIEGLEDLTRALLEAQADLDEHKTKIERGQRGLLEEGFWPFGSFPESNLYAVREERRGRRRIKVVHAQHRARGIVEAAAAFLQQRADEATLQAIAQTLSTTLRVLVRDLQSHRLVGVLDSKNLQLPENVHEHLRLLDDETFRCLQAYLDNALKGKFKQKPRSILREVLEQASLEELHLVSKGNIAIVCGSCKKVCSPVLYPNLANLERDVWLCPDGHKNRVIPDRVRNGLFFGNKSQCPTCDRHEHWERRKPVVFRRREWLHMRCKRCGTEILCTHEMDPILKRMLRKNKKEVVGPYEATRGGSLALLEYFTNPRYRRKKGNPPGRPAG